MKTIIVSNHISKASAVLITSPKGYSLLQNQEPIMLSCWCIKYLKWRIRKCVCCLKCHTLKLAFKTDFHFFSSFQPTKKMRSWFMVGVWKSMANYNCCLFKKYQWWKVGLMMHHFYFLIDKQHDCIKKDRLHLNFN